MQSVIEALAQQAGRHPDRAALHTARETISYGQLFRRVLGARDALRSANVEAGDRVVLVAPSAPAFVYGYFGAHALGAVAIPLDPNAPAARRDELVSRARAKVAYGARAEEGVRAIAELDVEPAASSPAFTPPPLDALADVLFTTGTTGRPKGVRLTHANVAAAARHINEVIGRREGDVEVVPLPLNHSFGLGRLRCSVLAGATLALVDGFRMPGEIFAALEKHGATGLVGVPAAFAILLRVRGLGPFASTLRYVEIGSAPMPLEHKQELMKLLPTTELWMHYGLTEASRSTFVEFHRHADLLDTVGRPAPGVKLTVRGDDGGALPAGETGLLWIGGPHVSPGYWDDDELAARVFRDGEVCTGDLASIDDAGFVRLHGRKDDMINVGGFNVSPDEVERVLGEHAAVREACCVGVADPRKTTGSVVRAYLVRADGGGGGEGDGGNRPPRDAELAQWVAARLEPYKVPAQFRWVASLPRTASGKLVRATLRAEAARE